MLGRQRLAVHRVGDQHLVAKRLGKRQAALVWLYLAALEAPIETPEEHLHRIPLEPRLVEQHGESIDALEEGVEATLRLAVDPELDGISGRYFDRQAETPRQRPGLRTGGARAAPLGAERRAERRDPFRLVISDPPQLLV